jgi:4-diphosphocytidyl-2-C-methyl-D-erythritol kinase
MSIMQNVRLADVLRFREHFGVEVKSSLPSLAQEHNIVYTAATLLKRSFRVEQGCAIDLDKRIPISAGLGGGSSDAATTLSALNRFWRLSAGRDQLLKLAEQLGSDVPFFLFGGTALIQGRGERVTSLPQPKTSWYLLVKPPIAVSTAAVYAELTEAEWSDGAITRQLAKSICCQESPYFGRNSLQNALFRLYPEAQTCFQTVQAVAPCAIVSGSGPTVVGRFSSSTQARAAQVQIQRRHKDYWSTVVPSCRSDVATVGYQ